MDVAVGDAVDLPVEGIDVEDPIARLARQGLVGSAAALAQPAPTPTPASGTEAPLPVLPALSGLLPGLARGGVVQVAEVSALIPALMAGPSRAGAWCAVVGIPELGLAAAASMGVDLERTLLVDHPGQRWDEVVAVLVAAVEVVVVRPGGGRTPAPGLVRRLGALVRRHGGVVVVVGPWDGATVRIEVESSLWTGLGRGEGLLRGARVHLVARGRGSGARPRRSWLWLPDASGAVTDAELALVEGPGG